MPALLRLHRSSGQTAYIVHWAFGAGEYISVVVFLLLWSVLDQPCPSKLIVMKRISYILHTMQLLHGACPALCVCGNFLACTYYTGPHLCNRGGSVQPKEKIASVPLALSISYAFWAK